MVHKEISVSFWFHLGTSLGVPVHVFGTETHMTAIVGMALGKTKIPDQEAFDSNDAATMFFKAAEVYLYNLCKESYHPPFPMHPVVTQL